MIFQREVVTIYSTYVIFQIEEVTIFVIFQKEQATMFVIFQNEQVTIFAIFPVDIWNISENIYNISGRTSHVSRLCPQEQEEKGGHQVF